MKNELKFFVLISVLLLFTACGVKVNEQVEAKDTSIVQPKETPNLPKEDKITDEDADCALLKESDVDSICGESAFVKDIPISGTEICRIHFDKGGKSQWLYLTYTQTGSSTPQKLVDNCLSGGSFGGNSGISIGNGKGCLYLDGQNLKIAGKKYLITISNSNPDLRVCTPEQMKEIGEKVISRLY